MVSRSLMANIAPLGSYLKLEGLLNAARGSASALPSAPVPQEEAAPLKVNAQEPVDRLELTPGPTAAPTLDDLEGTTPDGLLPTDLEPTPATYGASESGSGPSTASIGGNAGVSRRILKAGASGPEVANLQKDLTALGFATGAADGRFGDRTTAALKRFQISRGIPADGELGPTTRASLLAARGRGAAPDTSASAATPAHAGRDTAAPAQLSRGLNNRYKGVKHECFRYAWTLATMCGGRNIDNARVSYAGRNAGISHLTTLINDGKVQAGDVVYVNRRPGADPSSTRLAYGPHWFVYLGNNRFADQYGVKGSAEEMQAFVPGRKIDAIYHPFNSTNAPMYA